MEEKKRDTIKNWQLLPSWGNGQHLHGQIGRAESLGFSASSFFHTSNLVKFDPANKLAETENTIYTLE